MSLHDDALALPTWGGHGDLTGNTVAELKRGDAVELTVLPATVFAPLSVTDMDDAAKFELALEEYAKLISPHKDHWITPDSRGGFEAGWEAALAAMGIPVVDGE